MNPWKVLDQEEIWIGPVRLFRDRVRTHTGAELDYVYRPGPAQAAFILPILASGEAILIRQYRHPLGDFLLEIPAGKVEPGEEPAQGAGRELLEETGTKAGELIFLAQFRPQPSFTAVWFHAFLALGVEQVSPPAHEDGELIEPVVVPLPKLYAALRSGQIVDASTALTLFYAQGELERRGLLP